MAYLQIMISLGVGLLGLAYFMYSRPRLESNQTTQNSNNCNNNNNTRRRKTGPGDKCPICLGPLVAPDMRSLICGHSMHNNCYDECRLARTTCPICDAKYAELSEVGDDCVVCFDTMSAEDMEYMLCEHAMHKNCLSMYREVGNTVCPLCRRKI